MRKYAAILLTLFLIGCEPAYANADRIEKCSDKAYSYAGLVKYKDAGIIEKDVLEIIAPRLDLPDGWRGRVKHIVRKIYAEDLTETEVFTKIYVECIY